MTDFVASTDGVRIAWESVGEGPPIVLVHGFASDRVTNWRAPGWFKTLTDAGYRVVALDLRGHGESGKPHDVAAYDHGIMARDVTVVMDAAGIDAAPIMGYSMGGFIGMRLALEHAPRVTALIIGGVGGSYLRPSSIDEAISDPARRESIASALLEPDKTKIANATARAFRDFADMPGKDRIALAACMRADRKPYTAAELAGARQPVLVVCGENDALTGPPGPLAAAIPNGRAVTVPGRDHMTAVGDKVYKKAAVDFLRVI